MPDPPALLLPPPAAIIPKLVGLVQTAKYGPANITPHVQDMYTKFIGDAANAGKPFSFPVGNGILGGDPQPGVVKTCTVDFRVHVDGDVQNTVASISKAATEGQNLSVDIVLK